ncbi:MAG: sugar ABC transporter permease [Candidatus Kapabacteria bacterium]|nr:sugar ABC transporter permease [Candidatus Kapabacteria bacterium]
MKPQQRDQIHGYTMLMPWLLTFAVFWLYPLLYALYLSFTRYYTLSNATEWIGLANYTEILNDRLFWRALLNTSVFTFGTVPVTTSAALLLAVILNSGGIRFVSFFRAAFFMPTVTSLVVVTTRSSSRFVSTTS